MFNAHPWWRCCVLRQDALQWLVIKFYWLNHTSSKFSARIYKNPKEHSIGFLETCLPVQFCYKRLVQVLIYSTQNWSLTLEFLRNLQYFLWDKTSQPMQRPRPYIFPLFVFEVAYPIGPTSCTLQVWTRSYVWDRKEFYPQCSKTCRRCQINQIHLHFCWLWCPHPAHRRRNICKLPS